MKLKNGLHVYMDELDLCIAKEVLAKMNHLASGSEQISSSLSLR